MKGKDLIERYQHKLQLGEIKLNREEKEQNISKYKPI
jgi:hypothetical protein